MEAIAKTRHLKGSPRKARLVIDLIRGRNVSQALNILKFTDKRAAEPITKTLRSAIANATYLAEQQNIAIDPDDLFVKTCFVDMGAHKNRRRMRPAPQGRAFREQRHYCHITILVSSDVPAAKDEDLSRKKGKKLLAKEALGTEPKTPAKPKAEKKSAKAGAVNEESQTTVAPIAIEETKSAKAETAKSEQSVETPIAEVEVPPVINETETPTVEEAKEKTPVEEIKAEELQPEKAEAVKISEGATETETAKVEETKPEKVEVKADEPKTEEIAEAKTTKSEDSDNILEVDSPKAAKHKEEKQKAEASDAKNIQSQTTAERNETKKADDAQLNENDILELQ
jgi:large subunit ribosomal protein L22